MYAVLVLKLVTIGVKTLVFKYRIDLCIGRTFFPLNFVPKSGCDLYMLLNFIKVENVFNSKENDPERRYFQHPVYGYVMAKLLLREVTVLFSWT